MSRGRKRSLEELIGSGDEADGVAAKELLMAKKASLIASISSEVINTPDPSRGSSTDNESQAEASRIDTPWQTVNYKKKQKKNKKQTVKTLPRPHQAQSSHQPGLTFHPKQSSPKSIQDLQNLVLYTLADGIAPSWLAFRNADQCRKVVVVMVPGLEPEMLDGTWASPISQKSNIGGGAGSEPHSADQNSQRTRNEVENRYNMDFQAWKAGSHSLSQPQGLPREIHREKMPSSMKLFASTFNHIWPIRCPGDAKYSRVHSPLQAMLISPFPTPPENKGIKGPRPPAEERHFVPVRTSVLSFIHNTDVLRDAEYPIHPTYLTGQEDTDNGPEPRQNINKSATDGWVNSRVESADVMSSLIQKSSSTPTPTDLSLKLPIYSIDCEMVLTTDDQYSLARISVLDWHGNTVMDKYVLPSQPIKDYFTQFSGITPSHLADVTTTLEDIQNELLALLTPTTILLGHSLNSDLAALKMTHPFIVDTSIIYPHPRGLPLRSSLKFLAQKYLRREIQVENTRSSTEDQKGHDSVEDARAVLDLVKLKCEKGAKWGTPEASGEPIWRRLKRCGREGREIRGAIVDYGTPERGLGKEADVHIGCGNDGQVVEGIIRAAVGGDHHQDHDHDRIGTSDVQQVDFIWGRMRELEFSRGWARQDPNLPPTDHSASATTQPQKTLHHLTTLIQRLPKSTLVLLYTGHGAPMARLTALQTRQAQYRRELKVKRWSDMEVHWGDEEERELKRECERVRMGWGFVGLV